jgi:hypothetical protein
MDSAQSRLLESYRPRRAELEPAVSGGFEAQLAENTTQDVQTGPLISETDIEEQ